MLENSGSVTVAKAEVNEERENGADRFSAAGRWPRQETLALIKLRSDMDVAFRASGMKAPLWDEVSRRMAELGYDRSAKKCKEKFENVYKYHKRIKTCSYAQPNGRSYRFFDQLEALDHHEVPGQHSAPEQVDCTVKGMTLAVTDPQNNVQTAMPISACFDISSLTPSTSNTSSSASESEGSQNKKRKWAYFFNGFMKSVLEKQEDLQNKFLEAMDKCERDRLARDEEWKAQEMDRIKREHELLMQERSISAAKDAAVLAFLQKFSEQGKFAGAPAQMAEILGQDASVVYTAAPPPTAATPEADVETTTATATTPMAIPLKETDVVVKNENNMCEASSSRWPKEEVEALIRVRSKMELDYQKMGPKGPLWEDISMSMKRIGYDRSAKRCKEKWENINKYYRKVRETNKQRPVDSKTCPYFYLLDELYKTKRLDNHSSDSSGCNPRPEEILMHMMNHHPAQQHEHEHEHEQGLSRDGNQSRDENEHVRFDQHDYETVANDVSPMNIMGMEESRVSNEG